LSMGRKTFMRASACPNARLFATGWLDARIPHGPSRLRLRAILRFSPLTVGSPWFSLVAPARWPTSLQNNRT
jgi:hypothetical protein